MEALLVPYVFVVLLLGTAVFVWVKGNAGARETICLLTFVFIASHGLAWQFDTPGPVLAFAALDIAAGLSQYYLRDARWHGVIIGLFAAMLPVHTGYWVGSEYGLFVFSELWYTRMINALFVAQILTCSWVSWERLRDVGRYFFGHNYIVLDRWLRTSCGIGKEDYPGTVK